MCFLTCVLAGANFVVRVMVLNATFSTISVISWLSFVGGGNMSSHCLFHSYSVLLVEKTRVPVENDGPCRKPFTNFITYSCIEYTSSWKAKPTKKHHKYLVCKPGEWCRLLGASYYMALSHFIRRPGNSWQNLIWPCFLYKTHNLPNTL